MLGLIIAFIIAVIGAIVTASIATHRAMVKKGWIKPAVPDEQVGPNIPLREGMFVTVVGNGDTSYLGSGLRIKKIEGKVLVFEVLVNNRGGIGNQTCRSVPINQYEFQEVSIEFLKALGLSYIPAKRILGDKEAEKFKDGWDSLMKCLNDSKLSVKKRRT